MGYRQSDGRIVLMIAFNSAGGKPRGELFLTVPCHAELYQEGNISYTQR